jgi:hypothetical protein
MQTPIVVALVALGLASANAASAYHFNPPDASVHLHGKMTFTPNEGGRPFSCAVALDLKTKRSRITTITFPHKHCGDVYFNDLPWGVAITGANSGEILMDGFTSHLGTCVQYRTLFQVDGSGVWTLAAGQCFSGTLISTPPTTIVQ